VTAGKKLRFGPRSTGMAASCWLILGAGFAIPASAGSLKINPVHINLPAANKSVSLKMTNGAAANVSVRVLTYGWTQVDGRDVYTPTNNVIVSPPIFTIAPGATQLVRVGLRTPASSPQAYRLVVEEVPEAGPAGGAT